VATACCGSRRRRVERRAREELLASADRAMYLAKASGPGRYVVAED
jgi:PleD family two-component response regulator